MIGNFKLWVCMVCAASSLAAPAGPVLDIIDLAAISRMSPQQLEALAEGLAMQEIMRTKRSSAAALTSVASKASSGIGSKIGFIGQASAGAASLIASASSKNGHEDHGYSYEPHHEPKVDFWGLKKSILYTLFQAVKAITGGVTILKGQLIKGGGHLATTLGKVIAVKGDAVSNLGKKIVSSAALSHKKPHSSPPVYGPPPSHVEYAPTAYGAPTAPAHYALPSAPSAPSAPAAFSSHKYPSHLDGRSKLNGLQAGLVILAPLEGSADEHAGGPASAHTALEPPASILHTAFSAIKNSISSFMPAAAAAPHRDVLDHPPPPNYQPGTWGAVNSYGEPAAPDAYSDYAPHDYASAKSSYAKVPKKSQGLTAAKLQKIQHNLDKLAHLNIQRSSEELPHIDMEGLDLYKKIIEKGVYQMPMLPTPVVTDEVGVLPADVLPALPSEQPTTTSASTTTSTTPPSSDDKTRRRKDVKYLLKGNRIVVV